MPVSKGKPLALESNGGWHIQTSGLESVAIDGQTPSAIVSPLESSQFGEVLKIASEEGLKVIPSGGGTKIGIGAPPEQLDIILSTSRIRRVIENEPADLTATVEAGITLVELNNQLRKQNQWLPLESTQPKVATIGGIIASNSSGPRRFRYGSPRDQLIGLQFVNGSGTTVKGGAKVVKNVAGYDLPKLLVGSFGTLGVIVEATFKIMPLPPSRSTVVGCFKNLEEALAASRIALNLRIPLDAFELINKSGYQTIADHANVTHELDGDYFLAADITGVSETVDSHEVKIKRLFEDNHGTSFILKSLTSYQLFWQALTDLNSSANQKFVLTTRTSSRWENIRQTINSHESMAEASNLEASLTLNLGTGTLRTAWAAKTKDLVDIDILNDCVYSMRQYASTSHCHFIVEYCPVKLKSRMTIWGNAGPNFSIMQRLKSEFDPNRILSPGRFIGGL